MNFNKPSELERNSSDTHIKVLICLSIQIDHLNLFKKDVYPVCEAVSKYLEYLDNQVTRATEEQNVTEKQSSE